jgi:hypothetical protein
MTGVNFCDLCAVLCGLGVEAGLPYCFHATATPSRSGMMVVMNSGEA